VGQGTFYTLVTLADGGAAPPGTTLTVWAEPDDGHRRAIQVPAEWQQTRYGERFVAKVPFDSEGTWQVQMALAGPEGQGELSFAVRVTPSGIGWLATLACLLPFVILGGLWWRGTLRQRSNIRSDG
jgi:hypothetical protein